MFEEGTQTSDNASGSASADGNSSGDGQATSNDSNLQSQYDQLYTKFGSQGEELGTYRQFYNDVAPLMELLEKNPDIEEALTSGKFDGELAKAVLEGRVTKDAAATVADAHQQVKDDMGDKSYKDASAEDISKKVEELVAQGIDAALKPILAQNAEKVDALGSKLDAQQENADAIQAIQSFIDKTPDFGHFSTAVQERMEEKPGESIADAYEMVKARFIVSEAGKSQDAQNVESSKQVIANAGGGKSSNAGAKEVSADEREKYISMQPSSGMFE